MTFERKDVARRVAALITVAMLLLPVFLSCSGAGRDKEAENEKSKTKMPDEIILERAFNAIKHDMWQPFLGISITSVDYVMKELGITHNNARYSREGSVIKPRQIQELKYQFDMAVQGGYNQIDFRNAEFAGVGNVLDSGHKIASHDTKYYYRVYSLKLKINGEIIDTKDLRPLFVLSFWDGNFRVIELKYD